MLLLPAMGFAAKADTKEPADTTLAASEVPSQSRAEELQKDAPAASEARTAPVATVSGEEKAENASVATVKTEPVRTETIVSKRLLNLTLRAVAP